MDNFGGIAILVLIWIVGVVFDKKKKQERRRRQMAQQGQPPSVEVESVSAEPQARLPDGSQREGSKLEQLLRQLNPEFAAVADQALAQSGPPTASEGNPEIMVRQPAEPSAAVLDDGDDFMAKADRAMAQRIREPAGRDDPDDFMAKAERAIARRRLVADDYARGRTVEDHDAFHESARQTEEPKAAATVEAAPTLVQAIVWREILGPPRAMTIDEM
jgi:hypothetical protein